LERACGLQRRRVELKSLRGESHEKSQPAHRAPCCRLPVSQPCGSCRG
jgi:hypothetical protein